MIHTTKFMDNFYIFDNGMVRQFLITGADEAILIDTGLAGDQLYEAVRAVTDLPVSVIMTHGDPDHAGGLSDFGTCRIHRADWKLLPDGIELEPLAEGDVFGCGGYRLETIEIPGHTYGSVAFFDREKGLLLPGDSVQKDGPIYMFGSHRNLDLYIESQKKLCGLADEVKTIIPCHHDYPIGPEYISRNLEDAIAMRNGELPGTPHPEMPCVTYQGKWTAFYGERNFKIRQVTENKKAYLELLLLADEQESMIDRYLDRGTMYVLEDDGVKAECVVTDEGNGILEIKNLAVVPDWHRQGYGRHMIRFLEETYRSRYGILKVGTGDSPLTVPFYEACGFVKSHVVPRFFTEHYDHPVYEGGKQLVDMIYLQKTL